MRFTPPIENMVLTVGHIQTKKKKNEMDFDQLVRDSEIRQKIIELKECLPSTMDPRNKELMQQTITELEALLTSKPFTPDIASSQRLNATMVTQPASSTLETKLIHTFDQNIAAGMPWPAETVVRSFEENGRNEETNELNRLLNQYRTLVKMDFAGLSYGEKQQPITFLANWAVQNVNGWNQLNKSVQSQFQAELMRDLLSSK